MIGGGREGGREGGWKRVALIREILDVQTNYKRTQCGVCDSQSRQARHHEVEEAMKRESPPCFERENIHISRKQK